MKRKLRVLTITSYIYPGGATNRIIGMANGLDRSRFDQTIAMMQEPSPAIEEKFGTMLPYFAREGIAVKSLGERRSQDGGAERMHVRMAQSVRSLFRSIRAIERVVRELDIDVIDAHTPSANLAAVLAGRRLKKPSVITLYWIGPPAPIVLWPLAGRVTLDLATAVVTDSHARARDIQTWMYRRRDKVEVIPNGVPLVRSELGRRAARELLGVPANAIVIAQVGALIPHKGQMVLLDAAKRVIDREPRAFVLLIGHARGRAEYGAALTDRARELGIADRVRVGGYDGPIADVWAAADIQSHPSLFDSLPASIIEGMSAAMPLVATTTGGIPEMVVDGETGFLVEPNDADALAERLLQLIDDPALAARLGAAAFRRYQVQYTPAITAERLASLFYRCAGWQ